MAPSFSSCCFSSCSSSCSSSLPAPPHPLPPALAAAAATAAGLMIVLNCCRCCCCCCCSCGRPDELCPELLVLMLLLLMPQTPQTPQTPQNLYNSVVACQDSTAKLQGWPLLVTTPSDRSCNFWPKLQTIRARLHRTTTHPRAQSRQWIRTRQGWAIACITGVATDPCHPPSVAGC